MSNHTEFAGVDYGTTGRRDRAAIQLWLTGDGLTQPDTIRQWFAEDDLEAMVAELFDIWLDADDPDEMTYAQALAILEALRQDQSWLEDVDDSA